MTNEYAGWGAGRERERGGRKTSHGKPAMAVLRGLASGCHSLCLVGAGLEAVRE